MTEAPPDIMRRIFSILLIFSAIMANARQISPEEAQSVATEFFNSDFGSNIKKAPRKLSRAARPKEDLTSSQPYYIFNASDNSGFVIVSGDTRAKKILGYSDSGNFDTENMPPQLKAILGQYAKAMENIPASQSEDESWESNSTPSSDEGVLLETANWGQGYPYNAQCPIIDGVQAPTGCAATAMAIVMKYHNWPNKGDGSISYFSNNQSISYDFSTLNIDWKTIDSNPQQISELMYAAGCSMEMNYNQFESSSFGFETGHKLRSYFGYSINTQYIAYEDHNAEWESIILSELNSSRPIIYISGNHEFVCDGYTQDLYHFNFGWDGIANGYYSLPSLVSVIENSDNNIGMVIGIEPEEHSLRISGIYADKGYKQVYGNYPQVFNQALGASYNKESLNTNEKFDYICRVVTMPTKFRGKIGIALVDKDMTIKEIIYSQDREDLVNTFHRCQFYDCEISSSVEANDAIQLVSKEDTEDCWRLILGTSDVNTSCPVIGNKKNTITLTSKFSQGSIYYSFQDKKNPYWPEDNESLEILRGTEIFFVGENGNSNVELSLYNQANELISTATNNIFGDYSWADFQCFLNDNALIELKSKNYHSRNIFLNGQDRLKDIIEIPEALEIEDLTISGTLNDDDIAYIRTNFRYLVNLNIKDCNLQSLPTEAFSFMDKLRTIVLPDELEIINDYAFYMTALSSIIIPKSVNKIGEWSFYVNCSKTACKTIVLEAQIPPELSYNTFAPDSYSGALHIPYGKMEVYKNADIWSNFSNIIEFNNVSEIGCPIYKTIDGIKYEMMMDQATVIGMQEWISDLELNEYIEFDQKKYYVTSIADNAFNNNCSIESIKFPSSLRSIGIDAFAFNKSLKSVHFEDGIEIINRGAFRWSENLSNVNFPESLLFIDEEAFNGMHSLQNIHIPGRCRLAENCFSHVYNVSDIIVDSSNPYHTSDNGVLYSKDKTILFLYPGGRNGSFTVPANVTYVGSNAFTYTHIESLFFESKHTNFGYIAISDNKYLNHLKLPQESNASNYYLLSGPINYLSCGKITSKVDQYVITCKPSIIYLYNDADIDFNQVFFYDLDNTDIYIPDLTTGCTLPNCNNLFIPGRTQNCFDLPNELKIEMWNYDIDRNNGLIKIQPKIDGLIIDTVFINGIIVTPTYEYYYLSPKNEDVDVVVNYTLHERQSMSTHYTPEFMSTLPNTDLSLIPIESIAITPGYVEDIVGTEHQLSAIVTPGNATNTAIKWVSDNESVATVDSNGLLKLISIGSTTITATATDGSGVSATCEVIVEDIVSSIEEILLENDEEVMIYNAAGTLVFKGKYSEKSLGKGIYIVQSPTSTYKLVVK